MKKFETKFDSYVCAGETIQIDYSRHIVVKATIVHDTDTGIDDYDSHSLDPEVTGCSPEQIEQIEKARKAWFADEWFYCGVVLSVWIGDVQIADHVASLWGIEANYPDSDNGYLSEVANELLEENQSRIADIVREFRAKLAE